jgi:hypothetical protein
VAQIIIVNAGRHPAETCSCRAVFAKPAGLKFSLTAFCRDDPACHRLHCGGTIFARSRIARAFLRVTKEKPMSIGSIGGTSSLNQLWAAQAAQTASAVSPDGLTQGTSDTTSATGTCGTNALTGSTTASLDSQTLQALMDLTQQDPTQQNSGPDPSQAGSTGQAGQTQGASHHHHHHHRGGGMQASTDPSSDPSSSSSTTTGTSATTDAFGVASADGADDTTEASLTQALLSA